MCLLLIEGSSRLRESLAADFRRAGHEVESADDVERCLASAARGTYDVIVFDVENPASDWLDLVRRIRGEGTQARIILLTPSYSIADRVCGLNSGADDCLAKPFSFEELLARVHVLQRSRRRSRSTEIRIEDLVIDTEARQVTRGGLAIRLTAREFRILEFLARRRGETVSRIELEDHLYGEIPRSNSVPSAICLLRKKLGGERELVHTSRGVGYSLGVAVESDEPSGVTEPAVGGTEPAQSPPVSTRRYGVC